MLKYREQAPPASLSRWVECAWSIQTENAVAGHRVPPDACLDIIYDRRNGLRAVGTMTTELRVDLPEDSSLVGVRFRPGMAGPFLGVQPGELTDLAVALDSLWAQRAQELVGLLGEAKSSQGAISALLEALRRPSSPLTSVQRAIEAITLANGNIDLERCACEANLTPRQFRRRCLQESGLTPKLLARVLRFRHACRLAHAAGRPDWPDIAVAAHYFDQSHLIRDFRAFTRETPMSVFSNTQLRVTR